MSRSAEPGLASAHDKARILPSGEGLTEIRTAGTRCSFIEKNSEPELTGVPGQIKIRGLRFGGVPEWPKGSDCKSDGSAFGGSNPPPSTTVMMKLRFAGVVQW
jgi:hypothetical protein